MLAGTSRFTDLRDAIPDISDRMLCARLRELEAEGVVARLVSGETPVRVEYHLTDKGLALKGVVAAIGDWADRWLECPESGPDRHPERSEGSAGSCE
jgi:DNA-binding HxlR family transcriptional regulator